WCCPRPDVCWPWPVSEASHEVVKRRPLVSVVERRHLLLMKHDQRLEHSGYKLLRQHLGQHIALGLAEAGEEQVEASLVRHLVRPAIGVRIPHPAPCPVGPDLALAASASMDKPIDNVAVLGTVVARHSDRMHHRLAASLKSMRAPPKFVWHDQLDRH